MAGTEKKKKNNRKIIRLDNRFDLNIGTILFGMILIYLIIIFVVYLTREKVTPYEVVSGSLSGNYRYSALALKSEQVVQAQESGAVTYYAREGSNVGSGELICSVGGQADESGRKASIQTSLSNEDLTSVKSMLSIYSANAGPNDFSAVYNLKADLESVILQSSIDENAGQYVSGSYQSQSAGFVVYAVDGYEHTEESQLDADMFGKRAYKRENLRLHKSVSAGDDIYKLVTSETWYLYFPVDDQLRIQLDGTERIRVRFLKDNSVFTAPFTIISGKDGYYGKITLTNSLVRFTEDRFLDIELILSKAEGLKIPVSAIVSRDFYRIPAEYVTVSQSSEKEVYLQTQTFRSDGSAQNRNFTANVYAKDTDSNTYLVDASVLKDGDYIIMPGTEKKYEISDDVKETVQGVYNINKGYAVFREVNIVDQNEEFCIVNPENAYGLSAHDRIALDASKVKEDEIIA